MDIVVLLKQVPDTAALIQISEDNISIKTEDVKWVINPYDELAVEEAIRIKEKQGDSKITILTVGAGSAAATVRTALAMGADEGIHLCDPALENKDPQTIAKVIAAVLKNIKFDLIIAGHRAVDDDSFYVPAAVSEYLGIPLLSTAIRQKISGGKIQCEQTVQGGSIVVEANLPAIMTTQRGLNDPRYPSLSNIMKAKKKPIVTKTLADLGLPSEQESMKTRIISLAYPPRRNAAKVTIDGGTVEEKAAQLFDLLRNKAGVI